MSIAVVVQATAQWVNTGITVQSGDQLTISASGQWAPGTPQTAMVGPDGSSQLWPDNFLNLQDIGACAFCATTPTSHWAALIGYIGTAPPAPGSYTSAGVLSEAQKIFVVGSSYSANAGQTGTLWLNFNDDAYSNATSDNVGQVTAQVVAGPTGGHVPTLKLPWAIGDKDANGSPIYFTGGPHGAPVNFACDPNYAGVRPLIRLSGLDFSMSQGTNVLAVADGWITFAGSVGSDPRGPNVVTVDHGDGFMTQYWHLSSIDPAIIRNLWVAQGTRLGLSGIGDGHPHLHLEMRYYRNPNLPLYGRDSSPGLPYPVHGASLGQYTVRSEVIQGLKAGLNYNGNLTLGQESTVAGTACGNIPVTDWQGSNGTITAQASAGQAQIVTGSTNVAPTMSPQVTVQNTWTGDANNRAKMSFTPGQEIRFFASVNNTTGTTVTGSFSWQATGPRQILNSGFSSRSIPPGISYWYIPGTIIPNDAWNGQYSLRVQVIYNTSENGKASNFTIAAAPPKMYIVLTWPGSRADLDSHLWLPTGSAQAHIWYQVLGNLNNFPNAALDKDDVAVSGMETIAISQLQPGTYTYAVYNYGNTGSLNGSSGIGVRLYQNGTMRKDLELQTPAGSDSNRWWDVYRINVDANGNATITVKNQLVSTCPGPYDCPPAAAPESSKPTSTQPSLNLGPILLPG